MYVNFIVTVYLLPIKKLLGNFLLLPMPNEKGTFFAKIVTKIFVEGEPVSTDYARLN